MDMPSDDEIVARGDARRAAYLGVWAPADADAVAAAWAAMRAHPVAAGGSSGNENVERIGLHTCDVRGCGASCASSARLDAHIALSHAHECSTCGAAFASAAWLRLHVQEAHDAYFAALATSRDMYECLLPECGSRFAGARARRRHMHDAHGFPASFRFGSEASDVAAPAGSGGAPLPSCRFFGTARGCARGAACRYSHGSAAHSPATPADDDVDMDAAADGLRSLTLPPGGGGVSFGHRRARGGARAGSAGGHAGAPARPPRRG